MSRARLATLTCIFLALLFLTKFETMFFSSFSQTPLQPGLLMAALIFAHNSLAATTVAAGMLFLVNFIDALPDRFKRRDASILKYPRLLSAVFAVTLVFWSLFRFSGPNTLSVLSILITLPVAAIEVYGLYLAALYGLCKCVSAANMAKVYAVFLIGAAVETYMIFLIQLLL